MSQSKYEVWRQASLSQILADQIPIYQQLAGSDPETSEAIAFFLTLGKEKYIDLEDPSIKLLLGLLNARRMALFATSPQNNEITKMGMQMPKGESIISDYNEEG